MTQLDEVYPTGTAGLMYFCLKGIRHMQVSLCTKAVHSRLGHERLTNCYMLKNKEYCVVSEKGWIVNI